MNSTFLRALVGFVILTSVVVGMAFTAIAAVWVYSPTMPGWPSLLLLVGVAMIAELAVYSSTLHDPVCEWIKEPARAAENAAYLAELEADRVRYAAREAIRAETYASLQPTPMSDAAKAKAKVARAARAARAAVSPEEKAKRAEVRAAKNADDAKKLAELEAELTAEKARVSAERKAKRDAKKPTPDADLMA